MADHFDWAGDIAGIDVREGEFVVVTADGTAPLAALLDRVRRALGMDVVFVSQFVGDRRLIRWVAADANDKHAVPVGASDPLEESYCHLVVQGRLPEVIPDTARNPTAWAMSGTHLCRVGCHVAVPVITNDGHVFGTICCFSHEPIPQLGTRGEQETMRSIARLLANALRSSLKPPVTTALKRSTNRGRGECTEN